MRYDDVYLMSTAVCLPDRVPVTQAVAEQDASPVLLRGGISAVCVEPRRSAAELAAEAARAACAACTDCANQPPGELRAILHSYVWFKGAEMWTAAQYIGHAIGADGCPGYDLSQSCNGGMAALELAAEMVRGTGGSVLVTTGDRFAEPAFDRWGRQYAVEPDSAWAIFGDGGTAVLVGTSGGTSAGTAGQRVRLLSTSTAVDNSLEGASRGLGFESGPSSTPPDLGRRHAEYFGNDAQLSRHLDRMATAIFRALDTVLADGDTKLADVDWFVPPVATHQEFAGLLSFVLHADESATTWTFGSTTGHLGGGDQIAGLDYLLRSGAARPGQRVLLIGGGTGYACTCALVEVGEANR
jgi:3-oxoacyl-[acyl-carrier-protein] synthase-3